MNTLKYAVIAAAAATLLSAGQSQAEIKISTAGPMTGQYASFGEQMQRGAEMAVKDLNAKGGVLGQKLVLSVGYSHPVEMAAPQGLSVSVENSTAVKMTASDAISISLRRGMICSRSVGIAYRPDSDSGPISLGETIRVASTRRLRRPE